MITEESILESFVYGSEKLSLPDCISMLFLINKEIYDLEEFRENALFEEDVTKLDLVSPKYIQDLYKAKDQLTHRLKPWPDDFVANFPNSEHDMVRSTANRLGILFSYRKAYDRDGHNLPDHFAVHRTKVTPNDITIFWSALEVVRELRSAY